jgi:hypothetical protein
MKTGKELTLLIPTSLKLDVANSSTPGERLSLAERMLSEAKWKPLKLLPVSQLRLVSVLFATTFANGEIPFY